MKRACLTLGMLAGLLEVAMGRAKRLTVIKILTTVIWLANMGMAETVNALLMYNYVGNTFSFAGSPFSINDKITGYVVFGSAPTLGETNESDVVAFSFTAGPMPRQ